MGALKIVLTVVFIVVCVVLSAIVLMQEGKSAGLGSISGAAETYWGRNRSRSMEGTLEKLTKYLAIAFIVLSLVLNINFTSSSVSDANATAAPTATATEAATEAASATEEVTTTEEATATEEVAATEAAE